MKIGFFLGWGPQVKLQKEGLGRYLGGLLNGFQNLGEEVTIVCPQWQIESLDVLFESFGIDKRKINWITDKNIPPLWKTYLYLTRERKRHDFKGKLSRFMNGKIEKAGKMLADTDNVFVFITYLIFYFFLVVFFTLPLFIIFLLRKLRFLLQKLFLKISRIIPSLKTFLNIGDWQLSMFQRMNDTVITKLIEKANRQANVDVWYVPSIFWPQVCNLNGTVVINSPDLVTQKFPIGFSNYYNVENSVERCVETISKGNFFITYSEHNKEDLLITRFAKEKKNIISIPHINNDMKSYLKIDPCLNEITNVKINFSDKFSKFLVSNCKPELLHETSRYAMFARWDHMKFIFYASQVRPHKNIMSLIKAYEYLLRKKFVTQKLFLTCNLNASEEIKSYLEEKRLQNDVLCFYNIPTQSLAAFYACADLVVNPTLYEGGFPFTFGEGMSVGTPSLMSRIPQVQDVFEPAGLEDVMFDPYNWRDIADKIEYWLPRREELYQKELPLYKELAKRTPEVVAAEYIEAFQKFIEIDREYQLEASLTV